MKTSIPPQNIPFIDGRGYVSREWYLYLLNQFNRLGGGNSDTTIPGIESNISTVEGRVTVNETDISQLESVSTAQGSQIDVLQNNVSENSIDIASLQLDVEDLENEKEDIVNKVTSWSSPTTDTNYPSEKLVKDSIDLLVPYTGATGDVDLGTNGILANDALVGSASHNTSFSSTGHQTMAGDGRPWRDELGDALSIRSTGTGVSQNNSENTVEFTASSVAANDYLYLNVQLNHDKDLASSIYPHIHFFQANNNAPNFIVYYRWQINGAAKTTTWTPLKCNTLSFTYSSGTLNQIAYSSAISVPVGTTLSDILQFRIARDTGNVSTLFAGTDPYTGTVGIMAFDVHFMLNSIGSDTEYTK